VDNAGKIESLVTNVEKALVDADHMKLKQYSQELTGLVKRLRNELKQ